MSILFLLPGLVSLVYVLRGRLDVAFLSVYLPCILVLPDYYAYRIPHLPPISSAQAALIPLAIAVLGRSLSKWRLSRMDVWVGLYMLSFIVSEVTRERIVKDGILIAVSTVVSWIFPYIVGRQLIEPDLRLITVKRWVLLVLCLLPFGLYELRMGSSIFVMAAARFFGMSGLPWSVQLRDGHARIAMSFSDAELAGIGFATTLFLNAWLYSISKTDRLLGLAPRLGPRWTMLEKFQIPGLILLVFLLGTASRGPMAATLFGLVILQIPRFKNVRMASLGALIFLVVGVAAAYSYFQRYTNVTDTSSVSEQQQSAVYRRQLLENYKPVLEQGGWLGWGAESYPVFPGQKSIDNDFLLVQITQGRLGLILWILVCVESLWCLVRYSWTFQNRDDLVFVFALLAAMIALWITLATVFLGEQVAELSFLLFGWCQSLREGNPSKAAGFQSETTARFGFKKIIY